MNMRISQFNFTQMMARLDTGQRSQGVKGCSDKLDRSTKTCFDLDFQLDLDLDQDCRLVLDVCNNVVIPSIKCSCLVG